MMNSIWETEDRIWDLVLTNDREIVAHTNSLISLVRRVPGFPKGDAIVARALAGGFSTMWTGSADYQSASERTDFVHSVYSALFSLVSTLRSSDRAQWPGSSGCVALDATIQAVQSTVYKNYLGFLQEFLFSLTDHTSELSVDLLEAVLYHVKCHKILAKFIDQGTKKLLLAFGNLQEKVEQSLAQAKRNANPVETIEAEVICLGSPQPSPVPQNRRSAVPSPESKPSTTISSERVCIQIPRRKMATKHLKATKRPLDQPKPWAPPEAKKDSWEKLLFNIESVFPDKDGVLIVDVRWNENDEYGQHQCSRQFASELHLAAPRALLDYYHRHLIVNPVEPEDIYKRQKRKQHDPSLL